VFSTYELKGERKKAKEKIFRPVAFSAAEFLATVFAWEKRFWD
jgi:hypothetical protein